MYRYSFFLNIGDELFNLYKKCYHIKKHKIKNLIVIQRNKTSQVYYIQSLALPRKQRTPVTFTKCQ